MEPFSNHLQMKSCPAERQIVRRVGLVHKALTGILDVLFCAEIIEFWFPFWLRASGLYFGRMLALKPVKLCQSWIQAPHVCRVATVFCVWVNCSSGGISAPPHTCIHACSVFLLIPLSVFVRFPLFLPQTPTHADLLCATTSWFLCALVWRCCYCDSVSEASRTSPRACQRKPVIWSISAPKTCMCHRFTHKPLMFGGNHYSVRLYFLSISFMNEIGNCQRGFITPWVFSIRQNFWHILGLSENTPPESLLSWDYCQPTIWWLWQSSITCHYIREWPSHCVHFLFLCFLLYLRGQADEAGWPAQSQICLWQRWAADWKDISCSTFTLFDLEKRFSGTPCSSGDI